MQHEEDWNHWESERVKLADEMDSVQVEIDGIKETGEDYSEYEDQMEALKELASEHNDTEPEKPENTYKEPRLPEPSTFEMQSVGRMLLTLRKKNKKRWSGLYADSSQKKSN